jgi:lipid-binding SYLF domain-containing protein
MPPWRRKIGANGSVDCPGSVTSYVLTNAGLEAGVSLQGTKITKVVE